MQQQAFGYDIQNSNARINMWYNHFKDVCPWVNSEPRLGSSSTTRNDNAIEQVWAVF